MEPGAQGVQTEEPVPKEFSGHAQGQMRRYEVPALGWFGRALQLDTESMLKKHLPSLGETNGAVAREVGTISSHPKSRAELIPWDMFSENVLVADIHAFD